MPRGTKAGGSVYAPKTVPAAVILEERPLVGSLRAREIARPISIAEIAPNPENLRDDALDSAEQRREMATSLQTVGLIHPVVVCERSEYEKLHPDRAQELGEETKYVLLAGERRLLGAQDVGWSEIKAEIRNDLLNAMNEVFMHENGGRVDLNPFQEAEGYRRLQTEGKTLSEVAERSGKSKSHVSKRLRLLELGSDARELVLSGELSIDNAYNISVALGTRADLVPAAWNQMRSAGLSAKEAAQHVLIAPQGDAPKSTSPPAAEPAQTFLPETGAGTSSQPAQEVTPPQVNERAANPALPSKGTPTAPPGQADGAHANGGDRERALAAAERSNRCKILIEQYQPTNDPATLRIATAAVTSASKPALTLAHQWLVELGEQEAAPLDAKSYVAVTLGSGGFAKQLRLAYAIALAEAEVRTADRRRKWNASTVAHVLHLMEAAGYEPTSRWERQQLGLEALA